MKPTLDPAQFKASQREQWSTAAEGWNRWWRVFEASAQPLSERIVDLARIGPGKRVLDVATGIGEPAVTAARRVGPTGRVVGVDLAPQMIALARQRAKSAGLSNLEFIEIDGEQLDLPPASFDAVLSRWGVMLMPDPSAALAGMFRVLLPGGHLVACVWGARGRVPFMTVAGDIVQQELALEPAAPDAPGPLRLGRPGQLSALLELAGCEDVLEEPFTVTVNFESPDEYVRFLQDVSVTLRRTLDDHPQPARDRTWSRIADAVRRHHLRDGRVEFVNEVRIAHGRRP